MFASRCTGWLPRPPLLGHEGVQRQLRIRAPAVGDGFDVRVRIGVDA